MVPHVSQKFTLVRLLVVIVETEIVLGGRPEKQIMFSGLLLGVSYGLNHDKPHA